MKRLFILALLTLVVGALPMAQRARAQIRGNNITVTVEPDHADWTYRAGETARFTVRVLRSGTPIAGVRVSLEGGPVMYPDSHKQLTLAKGETQWTGRMARPGFYRLAATAHVDGRDYRGLCTAAFSPEQLRPYAQCPADFDAFWKRAADEARRTPLNPTRRLLPERCTEDVNVWEVSFQNEREGSRFYGVLSVPNRPGKFPALLRVPGAGVRPYQGDTYTSPRYCIVLEVGVHGIPVTMPQQVYDNLHVGALNNYWDCNLASPERNYYRRVVTGCLRAVDYIAQMGEWNGHDLGVTGSSQGGFLSLATAALDQRVTCIGVVHDALCDHEAELHGVAGGWPHYFQRVKDGKHLDEATRQRVRGAQYYDGVNFARRVTCPGWYSFGFNDEVVPPTSSYSTYNIVTAPKTLSLYQQTGHFWYQEQWDEWQQWLKKQLGIKD